MNINSVLILLTSVFITSCSQILLKLSANKNYNSFIREYLNIYVIIAYSFFFCSTITTVYAYRNLMLKYGAIIETFGYIFILILSRIVLKEKITKKKLMGIAIIICGVLIFIY